MTSSSTSTMSSSSPFSNAAGNAPRDSGDHGESQYGGHSMQGISGPTKGDYRLVGLADEDHAKGRQSNKGLPGAGLLTVPEQPQNPAFAIGSYCVASIVMTVVNKVRSILPPDTRFVHTYSRNDSFAHQHSLYYQDDILR